MNTVPPEPVLSIATAFTTGLMNSKRDAPAGTGKLVGVAVAPP